MMPAWVVPSLVDAALKGVVLVAIAAVAARLLAKRSAAARHAVWTAAIAGQLLIPILGVMMPAWRVPLFTAPWANAANTDENPQADLSRSSITVDDNGAPMARTNAPAALPPGERTSQGVKAPSAQVQENPFVFARPAWLSDPRALAAALWMLGVLVVLLRLAVGTVRVGALARGGERVEDGRWLSLTQRVANAIGVERPLILLRGERLAVPVTWGIVYPAVLLPHEADEWPEERRRFVLVHELAHVKRFDALTQLIAQITLALFWFNPLAWVAAHQMRVEREHACDDYVLRDGTPPSLYAGELLEMVRSIGTPAHESAAPAFAALAMARRSEFEGRMLAILDARQDRKTINRKATLMTGAFIALLALPLAALRPFAAEPASPAPLATATKPAAASVPNPVVPRTGKGVASAVAAVKSAAASSYSCDNIDGTTLGTSIHSNVDDEGGGMTQVVILTKGHCVAATMNGKVAFSSDDRSITSLAPGSFASFRERFPANDRMVSVSRGSGGALQYVATRNGDDVGYDAEMQSWLAGLLPRLLREAGINVTQRVARLRAAGGVPAVLAMIAQISSSGAKRSHYDALLANPLSPSELDMVLGQAPRDLSSSGDLSGVIQKVSRRSRASKLPAGTVTAALSGITSSGDKEATMAMLAPTADRELLLALAVAAEGISSSGDRANFLLTTAAHYLTPKDKALHQAYFRTAATLPSSGDLANVLISAVAYAHGNQDIVDCIFDALPSAKSNGDKANVLMTMASQRVIRTGAQRDAYTRAAISLPPGDAQNALSALVRTGQ